MTERPACGDMPARRVSPAALDAAAAIYARSLATRDSLPARDAAIAAGARTPTEIATLTARIEADRQQGAA